MLSALNFGHLAVTTGVSLRVLMADVEESRVSVSLILVMSRERLVLPMRIAPFRSSFVLCLLMRLLPGLLYSSRWCVELECVMARFTAADPAVALIPIAFSPLGSVFFRKLS